MPRTTIDLDAEVFRKLKRHAQAEDKSAGRLAAELFAKALKPAPRPAPAAFRWNEEPMRTRVDVEDRDAVRFLDRSRARRARVSTIDDQITVRSPFGL